MRLWLALLMLPGSALPALGEVLTVPSGMAVTFHDMISDAPGEALTYRFRFVAPEIGGAAPRAFSDVSGDMDQLCQTYALPRLSVIGRSRPG